MHPGKADGNSFPFPERGGKSQRCSQILIPTTMLEGERAGAGCVFPACCTNISGCDGSCPSGEEQSAKSLWIKLLEQLENLSRPSWDLKKVGEKELDTNKYFC